MSTITSFKSIDKKYEVYGGKDFMKKFFESLIENAMKIFSFKKLLTKEQRQSYENAKICYIYKEKFENKYVEDKKYRKVRDYIGEYRGTPHSISICNSKYTVPKTILIAFYNGYNYDYHYIIKELAEELKKLFV